MDRDFEIGNRKFKLCKLEAFKQFHVVRRLTPILSDLLPGIGSFQKLKGYELLSEDQKLDQVAKFAGPVFTGLAKLSDTDADFVLYGLLSAVEMQQTTGNWAKVSTGSMLMIQDMDLAVLIQLAGRSFMYNLSGFFAALPQQ